jgi:hypothetical protein
VFRKGYWRAIRKLRVSIEKKATAMLALGKKARQYMICNGIRNEDIYELPYTPPDMLSMPIDESTVKRILELKGDSIGILYLGRIIPRKGLLPLIQTIAKLRVDGYQCVLFVVGAPLVQDTGRGPTSIGY